MPDYRFKQYRRKQIAELRPYIEGEDVSHVSISPEDAKAGSPKPGDMIARNPKNHADQWLVARDYFLDNFEALEAGAEQTRPVRVKVKPLVWEYHPAGLVASAKEQKDKIASVLAGVGYAGLWAEEIMSALSKAGYRILAPGEVEAIRDKALEEAAAMCEEPRRFHDGSEIVMPSGKAYASAIRKLKSKGQ